METENVYNETSPPTPAEFRINQEINDTELLISRLRHPVIKRQVVSTLYKIRREEQAPILNDEWESYLPEGWDGTERYKLMKGKNTGKIFDVDELKQELAKPPITEEEIEEWYDNAIDRIESITEIDYAPNSPNSEVMHLGWIQPWNEQKPTIKQWSAIEAHEKGHVIRDYDELDSVFKEAFDISHATFTNEDNQIALRQKNQSITTERVPIGPNTLEANKNIFFDYLFSAVEITERMSQLKNYFGFEGAEMFTKTHLDYARSHYLVDTGIENGMRQFFEAVTPETEQKFLHIINNYGV